MDACRSPGEAVVVVPAHNEQALLPVCLSSLLRAADHVDVPVRIVVVLDDCTDGSATCVPPGISVVDVSGRSVGQARKVGFDAGEWREETWFATTDADSIVPVNWLSEQLAAAEQGWDVFAGTIEANDWTRWPAEVAERFTMEYMASDGHRHVHGANLGMWASVYFGVGGFALVDRDEDVDLVTRMRLAGMAILWSAQAPVRTSTRPHGRVTGGFADYLGTLNHAGEAS